MIEENKAEIGMKARIIPKVWDPVKKKWTHNENEKSVLYGVVGTIRSLGVIPTVKVLINTNKGYWWYGIGYDEMELVSDDTPLTIMWVS